MAHGARVGHGRQSWIRERAAHVRRALIVVVAVTLGVVLAPAGDWDGRAIARLDVTAAEGTLLHLGRGASGYLELAGPSGIKTSPARRPFATSPACAFATPATGYESNTV